MTNKRWLLFFWIGLCSLCLLATGCKKPVSHAANAHKHPSSRPSKAHAHKHHDHKQHAHKHHAKMPKKGHSMHGHAHHKKMPVGRPVSDRSVYQLKQTWMNQDGKKVKLASFRGKVQVIAMVYTYCPSACPIIVSDMKIINSKIPKKLRKHVSFILVSIDPKRDTPKRLQEFLKQKQLDPTRWTLLRGNNDQVLELSVLLGIKYKRISKSDFAHSNLITVLDKEGVIKHRQLGLATSPEESVAIIKKIALKK